MQLKQLSIFAPHCDHYLQDTPFGNQIELVMLVVYAKVVVTIIIQPPAIYHTPCCTFVLKNRNLCIFITKLNKKKIWLDPYSGPKVHRLKSSSMIPIFSSGCMAILYIST